MSPCGSDASPRGHGAALAATDLAGSASRIRPAEDRVTTRNDALRRVGKRAGRCIPRHDCAGEAIRSANLAKVGVAGSNPVVRSRSEAISVTQPSRLGDTLGDSPSRASIFAAASC